MLWIDLWSSHGGGYCWIHAQVIFDVIFWKEIDVGVVLVRIEEVAKQQPQKWKMEKLEENILCLQLQSGKYLVFLM